MPLPSPEDTLGGLRWSAFRKVVEECQPLDIPGLALVKPLPGAVREGRGQQCSLIAATRGLRQAAVRSYSH